MSRASCGFRPRDQGAPLLISWFIFFFRGQVNDFGRVALHAAAALEIDPGNAEATAAVRILEALAGATTAAKGTQ